MPASGPNPLSPEKMKPLEHRAELCGLLALGLIRLRMRDGGQISDADGEFRLHNSPNQSGTAEHQNGGSHDKN